MSTLHDVMEALRSLSLSGTGTGTATVAERTAYKTAADRLAEAVMPSDNGDGTVTFPSVPVIVPAELVADGSTVVAVRAPKKGERYPHQQHMTMVQMFGVETSVDHVRIILSDAKPKFEAGKWYRDTDSVLRGPLRRYECTATIWEWMSGDGKSYEPDGKGKRGIAGLTPGEVTVWANPPVSLKAGEYHWRHDMLGTSTWTYNKSVVVELFADWTDPPKPGRYKVPGGGKPATKEDSSC